MPRQKKAHELSFQQHIADFLVREHRYGVLEQSDITDTEHFIAEDQLWAFLTATQVDTLTKLTDDYGTDARDEVFKALCKELEHTPLWMLYRQGLPVRGLEFRLFYPKPRSAESAAAKKHGENRITFRPPGRPHLPRRRLSRAGERQDSDRLRRARTLRGTVGSQVHGHRGHLRHHGGHRDPAPSVIRGMRT
jgi:hypothetical protein